MHPRRSRMMTPIYGLRRTIAGLAAPAARAAFLPLPANGSQVNDDLANAIDPNLDAGVSDIVGGAVTAGKVSVRWATFEQKVANAEQQIFVRAFKNGVWTTQGFLASLNIDSTQEAEAPSIDFAGTGRTGRVSDGDAARVHPARAVARRAQSDVAFAPVGDHAKKGEVEP